ncbi:MAG: CBS domain-containing protein [Clostridia bacterium]|nr:CBS domain-containing protein [Clostridia bacterium]
MNILYFLTPKNQVANICEDSNLRQLMEKLEYHRYTAIPVIDQNGKYVGTVAEGDILRLIKDNFNMNAQAAQGILVKDIPRRVAILPVNANASMDDIVDMAIAQNFVPVTDDNNVFIGIVTRKDILKHFRDKLNSK